MLKVTFEVKFTGNPVRYDVNFSAISNSTIPFFNQELFAIFTKF